MPQLTPVECCCCACPAQHELTRPPSVPTGPAPKEAPAGASNPFSRMFQSMFGSSAGGRDPGSPTASAGGAGARGAGEPGQQAAGPLQGGGAGPPAAAGGVMGDSFIEPGHKTALAVRDAPGAGLVLWAESAAGAMELERPYTYSTSLDGELSVCDLGQSP